MSWRGITTCLPPHYPGVERGYQDLRAEQAKLFAHHDIIITMDSCPARPCSKQSAFGYPMPVVQGAAYPTATTLPPSTLCPQGSFGILADSSCRQGIDIRFDLSNHKDVLSFPAKYSLDTPWVDYTVYTVAANTELAEEKRVCVLAGVRRWWDESKEVLPAPGFPPGMPKADAAHVDAEKDGDGGRRNASGWFGVGEEGILQKREPQPGPRAAAPSPPAPEAAPGSRHFPSYN